MADLSSQTGAAPEVDSPMRTPWLLRVGAWAGVLVPVGMLVHLADVERKGLEGNVTELRGDKQALTAERDGLNDKVSNLTGEVGQLEGEVGQLEGEVGQLTGKLAGLALEMDEMRNDLVASERRADMERGTRAKLERKVDELGSQVATLRKREESLHGIIDLLEGEVASAERRLEQLAQGGPEAAMPLGLLGLSSVEPDVRRENERLRNELRKHDDQVVELLGEISVLNQELEIARGEREKIDSRARELSDRAAQQREEIDRAVGGNNGLAGVAEEN